MLEARRWLKDSCAERRVGLIGDVNAVTKPQKPDLPSPSPKTLVLWLWPIIGTSHAPHFMRTLLTSAHKYLALNRFTSPSQKHLCAKPLATSHNIATTGLRMSPRQDTLSIPNSVTQHLALSGGAPLRVKNSLSKEKVPQPPRWLITL